MRRMNSKRWILSALLLAIGAVAHTGCSGGDDDDDDAGDPQTPPAGASAIQGWLADGHYLAWACEPAAHGPLPGVSPHGAVRICSNDLMSAHGAGEYPVGSASVKELLSGTSGSPTIVGYAVSLHQQAGTTGDDWYWYEELNDTVLADAVGDATCVGCHAGAGSDASHPGHDFVYVQVP